VQKRLLREPFSFRQSRNYFCCLPRALTGSSQAAHRLRTSYSQADNRGVRLILLLFRRVRNRAVDRKSAAEREAFHVSLVDLERGMRSV
jgi:hypothetical protein